MRGRNLRKRPRMTGTDLIPVTPDRELVLDALA
ncbi:MAG: hypothetical protein ACI95S_000698, partial [Dinoroseobacter sp.]